MKTIIPACAIWVLFSGMLQGQDSTPNLIKGVFPTYPQCGIEKRVMGSVKVKAILDSDGKVSEVIPILPHDDLAHGPYRCLFETAKDASMSWEFEKSDIARQVILLFDFVLSDKISNPSELYPVYIPPFRIQIRGYAPPLKTETW